MPRVHFKVLLDAPLEAVWAFHEDVERALAALWPPEMRMRVTKADAPAPGAELVVRAMLPPKSWIGRETRWVARYVEFEPPHGTAPGRRAGFADEQVEGPFARWRHAHRFEQVLDEGRAKVWLIDEIEYALPFGPVGWIADRLLVRRRLARTFAYRHRVLRDRLSRRLTRSQDQGRS